MSLDIPLQGTYLPTFLPGEKRHVTLTPEQASEFYQEQEGTPLFPLLVTYMSSGRLVALCLMRRDAISGWKALMGPANTIEARQYYPFSLRARFGDPNHQHKNALHGSDSAESAVREIHFFFPEMPTLDYNCCLGLLGRTSHSSYTCLNIGIIFCLLAYSGQATVIRVIAVSGIPDSNPCPQQTSPGILKRHQVTSMQFLIETKENLIYTQSLRRRFLNLEKPQLLMVEPLLTGTALAEYLATSVNPTLMQGLAQLCKVKPVDPVVWLADWLLMNNPNKPITDEIIALTTT
uniref:Nucleoside diphosphate kinase homolog 5 n=1 Tax=Timema genevievae TaxID=629358 RepID=A0A7R9K6M7_TIMGE|nr:unnamed protein product [Timema genevievae]